MSRPSHSLPCLHDLSRDELHAVCRELGQSRYRADQIWRWLYVNRARSWEAMKNLPAALRQQLAERFALTAVTARDVLGAPGATRKILVQLRDAECVEAALIPARHRNTVCISSQVGCRFNCSFCASGKAGLVRNLTAGEMVGQVLLAADVLGERPSHIVFMGVGEPFDNYDAVLAAIRILNDRDGIGIGARRITISTCGILPGIERLATEGLQVELSVSLHAASSALRERLMPVERRYALPALLETCQRYTQATGRIITFEYTLVRDVNDAPEEARRLARRLAPFGCRVNLIPLSPVTEYEGAPAAPERAALFIEILRASRVNATLRDSKGAWLEAACGQLRIAHEAAKHQK